MLSCPCLPLVQPGTGNTTADGPSFLKNTVYTAGNGTLHAIYHVYPHAHDVCTVSVPFLPSAPGTLFRPATAPVVWVPRRNATQYDAAPGPNICGSAKASRIEPEITHSDCLDRYGTPALPWDSAFPKRCFAAPKTSKRPAIYRRIILIPRRAFSPQSGGSLQPLDRQFRYYILAVLVASMPVSILCGTSVTQRMDFSGEVPPDARNATLCEVAFRVPALVTGLPAIIGGGCLHRAFAGSLRPVCRYFGGCSCRVSAVLRAGRILFQQPVHHWRHCR